MTIAEKIIRAKEDYDAVYNTARDEGYDHGYQDGEADAYNRGYDAGKQQGHSEGVEDGKQAEHEAFWDAYIFPNLEHWQYLFYSQRWNDKNFYPTKDIKPVGAFAYGFSSNAVSNMKQRLIDCGVTFDTSGVTGGHYMFYYCASTHLPTISFVGLTTDIKYAFADSKKTVEIEKIILKDDGSTTFESWFRGCNALTTIAFEGVIGQNIDLHWSTNLSRASIENIVNHLSDAAEGKTLTLSKAAVDTEFYGQCVRIDPETGELIWYEGVGSLSLAWEQLIAPKIGTTENPKWIITLV